MIRAMRMTMAMMRTMGADDQEDDDDCDDRGARLHPIKVRAKQDMTIRPLIGFSRP